MRRLCFIHLAVAVLSVAVCLVSVNLDKVVYKKQILQIFKYLHAGNYFLMLHSCLVLKKEAKVKRLRKNQRNYLK